MILVLWLATAEPEAPVVLGYHPELTDTTPKPTWRWADDSWTSKALEYDKLEHFAGGYAGVLSLATLGISPGRAAASVAALAFVWEVKDGVYNPENFPGQKNYLSGDGFSWRDLTASLAGVALGFAVYMGTKGTK